MIEFRVLGSLGLRGSEGEAFLSILAQPKRAALLAYLAVATPRGFHRRDKLLGLFWPERDAEHARGALRNALHFLRGSLGDGVVLGRGDQEVGIAKEGLWCDAVAFEEALEQGEPEKALDLYRGELLEGFFIAEALEFERWLEVERARLRGRASEAAWSLAEREERAGNGVAAGVWARRAAALVPDDEGALRRVIELLERVGDRAGAMKEYEAFAGRMREDYEVEPSEETQALIARIRDTNAKKARLAEPSIQERGEGQARAEREPELAIRVESATGLRRFIHEIHRRSLWQVLLIYTGAALVAYQAVWALTESLGLPDWMPGAAVVLFIVGLPVVMATAFVQEGGPQVLRRESEAEVPLTTEGARGARRVLTWRNAIVGGVLAFVLLGIAVGGYMAMRVLGIGPWGTLIAKGVLEERDLIILAHFEDHTGDSTLALTVTEAFRVDLGQSRVMRVAERDYVGRVLQRMEREPDEPLTYDLAREVAIREGLKAVVTGEINMAGSTYVLSARLVGAETGEELYSIRETATDLDAIIPAIDRLSARLRERIGDSLKTINSSPRLARLRTASLEALRLHTEASQALRSGEYRRAVDLYSRAIEIDTLFAAAYRGRAIALGNLGTDRAQRISDAIRAYELRHRLPLRSQYITEARYHDVVTGDQEKLIAVYRTILELGPNSLPGSVNNLGHAYYNLRDYARAEEMFRRRIEMDSLAGIGWDNLTVTLFDQGRFDEAEETLLQWEAKLPDNSSIPLRRAQFASAQGDYQAAEVHLKRRRDQRRGSLLEQARFNGNMGRLAQVQGRLAEAEGHFRHAMANYQEGGRLLECLETGIELAGLRVWYLGDTIRALETMADVVEKYPLDSIDPLDRPYAALAGFYAFAGEPERARELLVEWETVVPTDLRQTQEVGRRGAWGAVALAEGRADDALVDFRYGQERDWCPICTLPLLAQGYELAGQPDSALVMYERYLTTPFYRRTLGGYYRRTLGGYSSAGGRELYWLPVAYERLGDLHEQRGDTAKAVLYYGKLVDLWEDADPELQPRVEAARRAIEALSPDA